MRRKRVTITVPVEPEGTGPHKDRSLQTSASKIFESLHKREVSFDALVKMHDFRRAFALLKFEGLVRRDFRKNEFLVSEAGTRHIKNFGYAIYPKTIDLTKKL